MGLRSLTNMYAQNDTINSMPNSSLNITQLMATSTTNNRRSRFRNPGQASPAPEDEDIYVSLQVLQAQLKTQSAPDGSQELLQRVLNKVDNLQNAVNNFSENYDFVKRQDNETAMKEQAEQNVALETALAEKDARLDVAQKRHQLEQATLKRNLASHEEQLVSIQKELEEERGNFQQTVDEKNAKIQNVQTERNAAHQKIVALQDELKTAKARSSTGADQADVNELRRQLADLYVKVERIDHDREQMKVMQEKVQQQDDILVMMKELQAKVEKFEIVQQAKSDFENRYRLEQQQNDQLLRRVWALEVENGKLKEAVTGSSRRADTTTAAAIVAPQPQQQEPEVTEPDFAPRNSVFRPDASIRSTRFWKRTNSGQLSAVESDRDVTGPVDSIRGDDTADLAELLDEDNAAGLTEMLQDCQQDNDEMAQFVRENEAADLDNLNNEQLQCDTILSDMSDGLTELRAFLEEERRSLKRDRAAANHLTEEEDEAIA